MKTPAAFWDGVADRYSRQPIKDMASYEHTLDRTRSYLGTDDKVLELGCGTASTAMLLAPGVRSYVASDVSPAMVEIGRGKAAGEGAENVELVVADVCDPRFAREDFDAVLALNLLHLLDDQPGALARIRDLVRPGGVFISKTPCKPRGWGAWRFRLLLALIPLMQLLGKAPQVTLMTHSELERRIAEAGFKIVESDSYPATGISRYIVARKV